MLRSIVTNNSIRMIFSFLLGAILAFTFAFQDKEEQLNSKSEGSFEYGDAQFTIVDDINNPDHPEIVDALVISKDDYPFIFLYKELSGRISYFAITDGRNKLALSKFQNGRISEFTILGNKVHDDRRMPVFTFDASDKPGVWNNVMYMPSFKAIVENGKLISFTPNGEKYDDIDFDGQFDAKSFVVEGFKYLSQSIYIDGKWKELGYTDSQGKFHQTGSYIVERFYAFNFEDGRKVEYDFEIGKGWKKRPDPSFIDDVR